MNKPFALTCIAVICWVPLFAARHAVADDQPSITVNGEAVVKVAPDKAVVSFQINAEDKDIVTAKELSRAAYNRAMKSLEACGVSRDAVQTAQLSVAPKYSRDYRRDDLIGYTANIAFNVTLEDPDKVEEVVTQMLKAGVTQVTDVRFETTEYKKHREKARELALLAAREKAEKMARTLGVEAGMPLQITETGTSSWGWRSSLPSQNIAVSLADRDGSGPLALGKISIRASVTVKFQLKSKSDQ